VSIAEFAPAKRNRRRFTLAYLTGMSVQCTRTLLPATVVIADALALVRQTFRDLAGAVRACRSTRHLLWPRSSRRRNTDRSGALCIRRRRAYFASVTRPASGSTGDDDYYCPICASVYLTANSFVPAAPVLPVPSASNVVEHFDHDASAFIASRRLAFQSRAPPLA
jgi:hypothetical protein